MANKLMTVASGKMNLQSKHDLSFTHNKENDIHDIFSCINVPIAFGE